MQPVVPQNPLCLLLFPQGKDLVNLLLSPCSDNAISSIAMQDEKALVASAPLGTSRRLTVLAAQYISVDIFQVDHGDTPSIIL